MGRQSINIGTPNGQNGDFVRNAFSKAEDNFIELFNLQTNLVDVSADWVTGLTFDARADAFPVGGEWYSATSALLTLDAADVSFKRIDLLVGDIDGTVKKITGIVSGLTPAEPNYDYATQYPIKFILVEANATEPAGYINEMLFNENLGEPAEWTYTPKVTNVTSVVTSHAGSLSIEGTNTTIEKVTFTKSTLVPVNTINLLSFWFLQKEAWDIKAKIYVDLYNTIGTGGVAPTPERITISDGQYGYDVTNTGWQKITIDFNTVITSGFSGRTTPPTTGVSLSNIDKIEILPYRYAGVNNGWFIDEVELQLEEVAVKAPKEGTDSLFNNGANGDDTYVESGELGLSAFSNDYVDLLNKPTLTEDFSNTGANGTSTYVEHNELGAVATSNDYKDLLNKPASLFLGLYASLAALQLAHPAALAGNYANVDTGVASDAQRYIWDVDDTAWVVSTSTPISNTSELVNDGADGTSTYAEHDELSPVAVSGDYGDLTGVPKAVQTVQLAEVILTPVELLDLVANPVVVVPAGGPDTVVKIVAITGHITYNSIVYNFVENIQFKYAGIGAVINEGEKADWNAAATGAFDIDKGTASGGPLGINEAVTVSVPTTDATTGNSNIRLSILYTIQDFTFI